MADKFDPVVKIDHLEQLIHAGQYDLAWSVYDDLACQITSLGYAHRCEIETLRRDLERADAQQGVSMTSLLEALALRPQKC